MQFLWKYIDDLAGKGLDWFNIFTLIFYSTMKFVPLAIPISIMVASIMTFGALAEKNESIALKCSGVSLKQILKPLVFLITILTLISFLFSNHILPYTNLKSISLLWDIRKQKPAVNFNEGEFYDEIDNFSIKINKKKGEILEDIIIYCHEKSGKNKKVFIASSGEMQNENQYLKFILKNGSIYKPGIEKKDIYMPYQKIFFEECVIRIDISVFDFKRSDENLFLRHYAMQNIKQLTSSIDSLQKIIYDDKKIIKQNFTNILFTNKLIYENNYIQNLRKVQSKIFQFKRTDQQRLKMIVKQKIELNRKYTLSLTCIIMLLIGVPIGSIIRKGGIGIPLIASTIIFVIYHVISISCEKLTKKLEISVFEGMWMPNIIFLIIAVFLTYKAKKDSELLLLEYYKIQFDKIKNLFKRK